MIESIHITHDLNGIDHLKDMKVLGAKEVDLLVVTSALQIVNG